MGALQSRACAGSRLRGDARQRREPERTALHAVVRENLETFLAEARERSEDGAGLPWFVESEFRRYLACGILAEGFARVRCGGCGHDFLVAFSCKRRGVCPSCNARRMHDTAAHLVDAVIPRVPVRQWVLSLPRWARWLLARDADLASRALAVTLRAIFARYRRPAERAAGCGAVTFIQRFGGALNLNLHFHCVVPDGVFLSDGSFVAAPRLSDEEVHAVLERIARKLQRLLRPHRPESGDALGPLDLSYAESVRSLSSAAGVDARPRQLAAFVEGFSLHAGVHLHANDRQGLEQLLCYCARGPLSLERLSLLEDGRVCYRLKRPLADGRCELFLQPTEFLRKLATLIPPPRRHLVRFHGVFGPNSSWRKVVVPPPVEPAAAELEAPPPAEPRPAERPRKTNNRLPWAELFRRVFRVDVLQCERCGGEMKVLAFVNDRDSIEKILEHLGLSSTGPPLAKARRPAQFDLAE